ncbi:MAG TPA: substrate-binding domain-containing protein [Cyclobacteriaceae bacterium]
MNSTKFKNPLLVSFLAAFAFVTILGCGGKKDSDTNNTSGKLEGTISLSGAFALYPLANKWAEEFNKTYPDVRFNISAGGAGKGMADALAGAVDLGMISREIKEEEKAKGAWPVAVTKDAVIPTISSSNPVLATLKEKGLTKDEFRKIFITTEFKTWGQAIETNAAEKINVYSRSDASGAAATWAQYLGGKEQDELKGIGVFGDPGLADAVKKDFNGIGFNNIIYVFDINSKAKYPGIEVLPIDVNGDNKITTEEQFYGDMSQLVAAINDGRYPSPPARELYFVSKDKPQSEAVKIFLNWVLNEGQKFVTETGYIQLPAERLKAEVEKLK